MKLGYFDGKCKKCLLGGPESLPAYFTNTRIFMFVLRVISRDGKSYDASSFWKWAHSRLKSSWAVHTYSRVHFSFPRRFSLPHLLHSLSHCFARNERNTFIRVFTAFVFMNDFCLLLLLLLSLSRFQNKSSEAKKGGRRQDKQNAFYITKTKSLVPLPGKGFWKLEWLNESTCGTNAEDW